MLDHEDLDRHLWEVDFHCHDYRPYDTVDHQKLLGCCWVYLLLAASERHQLDNGMSPIIIIITEVWQDTGLN